LAWLLFIISILVDALLGRGDSGDIGAATALTDRPAAIPAFDNLALTRIYLHRIRALIAQAQGDDAAYRTHRDRYREMASTLGFEGHMQWAAAMP
jgi:hypothetical protein